MSADVEMQETGSVDEETSEAREPDLSTRELKGRKKRKNVFKHVDILSRMWQLKLKLAVVCIVIVVIWGLLTLPVTFYYLFKNKVYKVCVGMMVAMGPGKNAAVSWHDMKIMVYITIVFVIIIITMRTVFFGIIIIEMLRWFRLVFLVRW